MHVNYAGNAWTWDSRRQSLNLDYPSSGEVDSAVYSKKEAPSILRTEARNLLGVAVQLMDMAQRIEGEGVGA